MLLVLSSIEDAFALSHNLDTSYFDKVKNFSENRAKTYLAGRALLQSVLHHFYSIESLPNIKKTEKGKPFFDDVASNPCRKLPFFNISHKIFTKRLLYRKNIFLFEKIPAHKSFRNI